MSDRRPLPKDYPPILYVPCVEHVVDPTDLRVQYRTTQDGRVALLAYSAARVPSAVGRGLIGLGVLATGYGVYDDIQHGESPAQAAVSNGVGFAASMATGAYLGAAIGSVVPGPGTAIGLVAGTLIGTGVGLFTSGVIDSVWENGVDDLGAVGDALGDG